MAQRFSKPFYDSKAWKLMRTQILRRDNYECHDCGGHATEVHHMVELTPENIHDENIALNPALLMSLCGECHKHRTNKIADVGDGYYFDKDGQLVKD